jgi:hypothetical protein
MKITPTKKHVACLAGLALGATLLIGGTGASMIELVSPPTDSRISNTAVEWKIDLVNAVPLDADLTPGAPVATLDLSAKNSGTLPANVGLTTDQLSLDGVDLDSPLLAQAKATVKMQVNEDPSRVLTYHGSLSELLPSALVMDDLVKQGETVTVHIEVTPVSVTDVDASVPVKSASQTFKTGLLFSQGDDSGTGQLASLASASGIRLVPANGSGGWLLDADRVTGTH